MTDALCVNDCKSLAGALHAAGSAASKTSEDKRLGILSSAYQATPVPQRNAFPLGRRRDGQGTRTRRTSEEAAAHCLASNPRYLRDVGGKTTSS